MKKINWNNVGWRTLQGFIVAILNTPLWVYLIGSFVPYETVEGKFGKYTITWIDYLQQSDTIEWYHVPILMLFMVLGILASIAFIKFLYVKRVEDKRFEKQTQILKGDKNARDIDKYL